MMGGDTLTNVYRQLQPEPCRVVILRQQGEVIIEALDDDFATLLLRSKSASTRQQLGQGLPVDLTNELLDFAIAQGLLLPTI